MDKKRPEPVTRQERVRCDLKLSREVSGTDYERRTKVGEGGGYHKAGWTIRMDREQVAKRNTHMKQNKARVSWQVKVGLWLRCGLE